MTSNQPGDIWMYKNATLMLMRVVVVLDPLQDGSFNGIILAANRSSKSIVGEIHTFDNLSKKRSDYRHWKKL